MTIPLFVRNDRNEALLWSYFHNGKHHKGRLANWGKQVWLHQNLGSCLSRVTTYWGSILCVEPESLLLNYKTPSKRLNILNPNIPVVGSLETWPKCTYAWMKGEKMRERVSITWCLTLAPQIKQMDGLILSFIFALSLSLFLMLLSAYICLVVLRLRWFIHDNHHSNFLRLMLPQCYLPILFFPLHRFHKLLSLSVVISLCCLVACSPLFHLPSLTPLLNYHGWMNNRFMFTHDGHTQAFLPFRDNTCTHAVTHIVWMWRHLVIKNGTVYKSLAITRITNCRLYLTKSSFLFATCLVCMLYTVLLKLVL